MGFVSKAMMTMQHKSEQNKKKKAQRYANSWRGRRIMKSNRTKKYIAKRESKLRDGVALREREEQDASKGERVWFSRQIYNGRLQHWVLITHNTKYELRRAPQQSGEKYMYNTQPYTIDQEKRNASLTQLLVPDLDGYYVCLIGWTRLAKDAVDQACEATMAEFGTYNLLRNNCQHFLKRFSDIILVPEKAQDYPWFFSNTRTKYQKDQWLRPPPDEMLVRTIDSQNFAVSEQLQWAVMMQLQLHMHTHLMSAGAVSGGIDPSWFLC